MRDENDVMTIEDAGARGNRAGDAIGAVGAVYFQPFKERAPSRKRRASGDSEARVCSRRSQPTPRCGGCCVGEAEIEVGAAAVEGRAGVNEDADVIGGGGDGGGGVAVMGEDEGGGAAEAFPRSSFRCCHHWRASCGQRNMNCADSRIEAHKKQYRK